MKTRPQLEPLEDRCLPASVADLGWTGGAIPIAATVDQELTTVAAHTGDGSWRMSNAGNYNGMFDGFPMSPALAIAAQEGTAADMFVFTVWFKAVGIADGSNIEIDLGTGTDRDNFLAITNLPTLEGGLQLRIGDNCNQVVFGWLDAASWHRLDVAATLRVGEANDTYTAALDGLGLGEFHTLEAFFADRGDLDAKTVDRVFFRSGYNVDELVPGGAGSGFYFDDLAYSVRSSADPATMLAQYETSFNHGGTPQQYDLATYTAPHTLTRREQRALLKQQRMELAASIMAEQGIRWRTAWKLAGRALKIAHWST